MSLRKSGSSEQCPFEKVEIQNNIPSGKWDSGLGLGIISFREISYFGQMFNSGNLLFGIMESGNVTSENVVVP